MNTMIMAKSRPEGIVRRILFTLGALVLILVVIVDGIYLWAFLSTGTSLVARGIMWGDADVADLYRFPTRPMKAATEPVVFDLDAEDFLSPLPIVDQAFQPAEMPLATYLEKTNTTAFIVLHGDQLLYEGYFNGSGREAIQTSFSAAKSFTSSLVGIALAEGYIRSLDDPITDYLPELLDRDPRFAEITIRHLLTMTSGLRWERNASNPFSDDFVTYYSPDLRATVLESEIVEPPGERFFYTGLSLAGAKFSENPGETYPARRYSCQRSDGPKGRQEPAGHPALWQCGLGNTVVEIGHRSHFHLRKS